MVDQASIVMPEFVGADFKNEWRTIPEKDYHSDLTAVARGDILAFRKSGKAFLARRGKEADEEGETPQPLRIGRAAHILALEPHRFKDTFVVMPEFTGMTKDGKLSAQSKEARDKKATWLADRPPGTDFVTEEELNHLRGMCEALLQHPQARSMFENGILENVGYYRDPETGLKCRIKPDCISERLNGLFDFKTARDVSYKRFSNSVWDNRYDIQLVKYAFGAAQILGRKPDVLGWVAVEKTPPYEVAVWIADEAMIELAERHYRKAMNGIAEAVRTNTFTFRQKEAQNLGLPQWAFYEEE
jgi:exodeoxyribonuclease VIII